MEELKRDCSGCHGQGQVLSKLDMRTREGLLAGGARGPAILPGRGAGSLLVKALEGNGVPQMPPGTKPRPDLVARVRAWIDSGAPWSESNKWGNYNPEDLWAFQPRKRALKGGVDEFIQRKLARRGLQAAPRAGRRTLIRRAAIDLTGLPPTAEEVDAFLNDRSPGAWANLIDRLLASPRYGERWGRHWLDVVRYADTNGYSNDFERPNAWRYRDYVIRSFNQDKPYNRFIKEQVAGDELYPKDPDALIATGFLRSGPWEHTGMSVEAVTRQMFLDDVTHATAATFLGLTLGCAKCHDHKFDPIPTRDYYRMQAVFSTTEFARPKLGFLPTENTAGLDQARMRMQTVAEATREKLQKFDEIAKHNAMRKHGVSRPEDLPKDVLAKAIREKEGITPDEYEELKLYQKHGQLYRESLDRFEAKAFAVSSGPLDGATDGGPNLRYPKRAEYKPPEVHILTGGNMQSPGERVEPGLLSAVARYSNLPEPEVPATVAGRRSALANWIVDPKNPLTARVMVNRTWQYHFGSGLARDANNFGKMGAKPSHPELLDWLADRFIESGWSVKALHRLIMLSETYQRSSGHPSHHLVMEKDPDNKLLAFYPPRRVEAEVLRDSILAVAGELSLEAGGPGVFPEMNEDVARQPRHAMGSLQPAYRPSTEKRQRNRRTIYTFQQRSLVDPMLAVFNSPNLDMSCERREASTVPSQAFSLFNSQFAHDMALALADRVTRSGAASPVRSLFRRVYAREPSHDELRVAQQHLARMTQQHQAAPAAPRPKPEPVVHTITSELTGQAFRFVQENEPGNYEHNLHPSEADPSTRALADLALVLINSSEFVYVY